MKRSFPSRCVWAPVVVGLALLGLAAPTVRADGDASRARAFVAEMEAGAEASAATEVSEPIAQPVAETLVLPAGATISARDMIIRVLLGLGLILGILAAVLFLYRKATHGTAGLRRHAAIEVLTQRSLGNRTGLSVVRVAGETLLLGVTQHRVTLLSDLTARAAQASAPPADAAAVDALLNEVTDAPQQFEQTLAGEVNRVRKGLWTSLRKLES